MIPQPRARFVALAALPLLCFGAASRVAVAADFPCRARPTARFVDVAIRGDAETVALVRADLAEFLGRRGLILRATPVGAEDPRGPSLPASSDIAVRATVVLRDDGAEVLMGAREEGAPVIRREITAAPSRPVLAAEVAEVVHAATNALCDATEAPPPRPVPAQPAPVATSPPILVPPPASRTPEVAWATPRVGVGIAVNGAVQRFADNPDVTFGLGGGVGLSLATLAPNPSLWLLGRYFFPGHATSDRVDVQASRASFRLQTGVDVFSASGFRLGVAVAGGADVVFVNARIVAPFDGHSFSPVTASPIVAGALWARLRIAEGTDIDLAGLLDADLIPVRYNLRGPAGPLPVMTSFALRPGLTLGFVYDFFAPSRKGATP